MRSIINVNSEWINNIEIKCGPLNYAFSFANNALAKTGQSVLGCGVYYGLLIQSKYFKGM